MENESIESKCLRVLEMMESKGVSLDESLGDPLVLVRSQLYIYEKVMELKSRLDPPEITPEQTPVEAVLQLSLFIMEFITLILKEKPLGMQFTWEQLSYSCPYCILDVDGTDKAEPFFMPLLIADIGFRLKSMDLS